MQNEQSWQWLAYSHTVVTRAGFFFLQHVSSACMLHLQLLIHKGLPAQLNVFIVLYTFFYFVSYADLALSLLHVFTYFIRAWHVSGYIVLMVYSLLHCSVCRQLLLLFFN